MIKGRNTKDYLQNLSRTNEYKQTDKERAAREELKNKYYTYYHNSILPQLKNEARQGKFEAIIEFKSSELKEAICLFLSDEKMEYKDVSSVSVGICRKVTSKILVSWR